MATPKSVWGIDVGQCAIKALKLRSTEAGLEVEAFDIIEHPIILSEPEADSQEIIRNGLEQFLDRNDVSGSEVAIAVPGQSSFTRFVKLPPVESKRIPDIVRFEAAQQIPFAIEEVIWQWQTFHDPNSPDVEVGIFAMKRVDIAEMLDHFNEVGLEVNAVQIAPLSLYNFMVFDEQVAPDGATLLVDVGADKTDLVVSDGSRVWMRTIQIGGNNFTEALLRAFKLSFVKAEKLKRTAATSKYARQIFQAMRPVFADLVQEIQRSIGYYTSLHRETRFNRLVGIGNGFRLPGLQKFLEQNLNISVVRVDSYNNLGISSAVNAPVFAENALSFAVSYGLALQALGEATVSTNLLPTEVSRRRIWVKKRLWFVAAAVLVLACAVMPVLRTNADAGVVGSRSTPGLKQAQGTARGLKDLQSELGRWENQGAKESRQKESYRTMYRHRDYWPTLQSMMSQAAEQAFQDQKLLAGPTAEARRENLHRLGRKDRNRREVFVLESMQTEYAADVAEVSLRKADKGAARTPERRTRDTAAKKVVQTRRGFKILITGRTPLRERDAHARLSRMLVKSREIAEQYDSLSVVDQAVISLERLGEPVPAGRSARSTYTPAGAADDPAEDLGPLMPDPAFPKEDMSEDTRFEIGWVIAIEDGDEAASAGNNR